MVLYFLSTIIKKLRIMKKKLKIMKRRTGRGRDLVTSKLGIRPLPIRITVCRWFTLALRLSSSIIA
jgi:hypothetical protein